MLSIPPYNAVYNELWLVGKKDIKAGGGGVERKVADLNSLLKNMQLNVYFLHPQCVSWT